MANQAEAKLRSKPVTLAGSAQVIPPYSDEAEKAVLCCMMDQFDGATATARARQSLDQLAFFVPAHQIIYGAILRMSDSAIPVDLLTLSEHLKAADHDKSIGGPAYLSELATFGAIPSNIDYYLETVRDKYARRELIRSSTELVRLATQDDQPLPDLMDMVRRNLERVRSQIDRSRGVESFPFQSLLDFDPKADPNVLIGNRWLCRGFTSLWAGPAGSGKSTLEMQLAIYWACGLACFGMKPVHPLKSLIVQAENDLGDTGEQLQGVIDGIVRSTRDIDLDSVARRAMVESNLRIKRVVGVTGERFVSLLEALCEQERSDCVWVDPLFGFAGCDLLNAKEIGCFLREGIIPLAVRQKVCVHVVHHVGKPARDGDTKSTWADTDFQYLGFGSSEIQNAFRAVNVLLPLAKVEGDNGATAQEQAFRLIFSKRGSRAGALDVEGNATNNLYLAHSQRGICWLQTDKPPEKPKKRGRQPAHVLQDLLDEMEARALKTEKLQEHVCTETGMSRRSFFRLFKEARQARLIEENNDGWTLKPCT